MNPAISNEIDIAVKRLVEKFHPHKIILFGSQARGIADTGSDVDFLIIMPLAKFGNPRLHLLMDMIRELRGLCTAFDLIILTPEEYEIDRWIPGTMALPVSHEGKILYEAA